MFLFFCLKTCLAIVEPFFSMKTSKHAVAKLVVSSKHCYRKMCFDPKLIKKRLPFETASFFLMVSKFYGPQIFDDD